MKLFGMLSYEEACKERLLELVPLRHKSQEMREKHQSKGERIHTIINE